MRRCPRHGDESVQALHAIDESLCYGPCDVHVACEYFQSAAHLSIKSNMVVIDVALDHTGTTSLKPSSATFLIYLEDIVEIRSFSMENSGPEVVEQEMEEGVAMLLNSGQGMLLFLVFLLSSLIPFRSLCH